jgi:hypothetical protein
MEAVRSDEIELLGEDGGRVTVSFDDRARDVENAGVVVGLAMEGERARVRLDAEETNQLRAMIAAQIPGRKHDERGVAFDGKDGDEIRIYPSNMGEPFREGLEFYYVPKKGAGVSVFLENQEALKFGRAIDRLIPSPAASPSIRL